LLSVVLTSTALARAPDIPRFADEARVARRTEEPTASPTAACANPQPGADLRGCNFNHQDLSRIDLSGADLSDASFNHAKLIRANLSHAKVSEAQFIGADLSKAVARGLDDVDAVLFTRATMRGIDLSNANLLDANLRKADLRDSILHGAELEGASLQKASLAGADLSDVDFSFTNLAGASLTDANLESSYWEGTVCPDGSNSDDDDGDNFTCLDNLGADSDQAGG
jgi:uncharacterized protein YjbI with pentapeptide repeats